MYHVTHMRHFLYPTYALPIFFVLPRKLSYSPFLLKPFSPLPRHQSPLGSMYLPTHPNGTHSTRPHPSTSPSLYRVMGLYLQ